MNIDFSAEYEKRSDDELLRLASERASLTDEALVALDQELSRRRLTKSDEETYRLAEKRDQSRQAKKALRRALGTQRGREEWFKDLILLLIAGFLIALISALYQTIPNQYRLSPNLQETGFVVMLSTVLTGMLFFSWWRKGYFWLSLLISTVFHFLLVHTWLVSHGPLSSEQEKWAVFLGFLLFFVAYGCANLIKRRFRAREDASATYLSG